MPNPALAPDRPMLSLCDDIAFARGRVHELCGTARRVLAAMLAGVAAGDDVSGNVSVDPQGAGSGAVVWAMSVWARETLYPQGLAQFLSPDRLIVAVCPRAVDILWTVEEVLRSGSVTAVVAELAEPPGLTPIRRLQLAAEAGGGQTTGFLLSPGTGGAPGVESRWSAVATPDGGWQLDRLRARMAPHASFALQWGVQGPRANRISGSVQSALDLGDETR